MIRPGRVSPGRLSPGNPEHPWCVCPMPLRHLVDTGLSRCLTPSQRSWIQGRVYHDCRGPAGQRLGDLTAPPCAPTALTVWDLGRQESLFTLRALPVTSAGPASITAVSAEAHREERNENGHGSTYKNRKEASQHSPML